MKSYLFLAIQLLSVLVYSQKFHINEDFNNTQNINSLPLWTSPTQAKWNISNDVWASPGNQSLNGSNLAFINVSHNSANVGYLYSPIFDNTSDSLTRLTFDYNFHSDTFQFDTFFVEIYNNQQWNRIFSRTTDDCGSFLDSNCIGNFPSASIDLSAYQSDSSQLRFGYSYLASKGIIAAIDNIVVFSKKNKDLNLFTSQTEFSGCEMLDSIPVYLSNEGFNSASSANVSYSLNGSSPISIGNLSNIFVNDTIQLSFLPNNLKHGRNEIKIFHDWQLDENKTNDTVSIIVQNYMIENYHTEGFESFVDGSCDQVESQLLKNGWSVESNKLIWSLESSHCAAIPIQHPRISPRPEAKDGNYFYTSESLSNNNSNDSLAILSSPCIDLSSFSTPQISFWYHKLYTSSGKIQVELFDTSAWTTVLSIQGQGQANRTDPWKYAQVDLSAYAGKNIQLRFVGEHEWRSSWFIPMPTLAIDEIVIYDKLNQDVGLVKFLSPATDSCNLSSTDSVQIQLANYGNQSIAANSLSLELYHNDSLMQTETITNSLNTNDSLLYTFNTTLDLSSSGEHQIKINAILSGDTLRHNNSIQTSVYNQSVQLPYFFEDFENTLVGNPNLSSDGLNGWTRQPDSTNTHTWQVWQGPAPLIEGDPMRSIPPNGPSGDHTKATYLSNGNGKYIKLKSDFTTSQPPAHLISPCGGIDLSASQNNKVLLTFWYHMFGNNTNDLFIDIYNGSQWINGVSVIRGEQQWMSNQAWRKWQVPLNNFTNVSNAKIRFRASGISNVGGGDMGLDDIRIFDRDTTDMALLGISRPESDCGLSNQEQLRVRLQNTGTNDIYNFGIAYQLTHTDLNGQSQTSSVVRESTINQIIPLANYTYNFTNRLNLSQAGTYQIKVWSELSGDGYAFNDTLIHTVKNTIRPTNYCEDFNGLSISEEPDLSFGNYISNLSNDWIISPEVMGTQFRPTHAQNTFGINGRNSNVDDLFLLNNSPIGISYYTLSPCIEIADSAKQLEFWYNVGASSSYWILIQGDYGGVPQIIDTIKLNKNTSYSWQKASVSIADYRNTISKFRLIFSDTSSQSFGSVASYIAFDDFCITDAPDQEIQLIDFPKIFTTECGYSNQESMQFTVRNVGKNPIDSFMVISTVDTSTRKSTNHYFTDTSWFYPSPSLNFDDIETYTINSTVDMSHKTKYIFDAKVVLPAEKVKRDNFYNNNIINKIPIDTNYITDFENYYNRLNGLILPQNNGFNFKIIRNGNWPSIGDHTKGTNGYYLLTDPSTNNTVNDTAFIFTPCFDLNMMATPTLSFWYHKTASPNYLSEFQIDVRTNGIGNWQALDSVGGTSFGRYSPYLNKAINLSNYSNQIVQFRIAAKYENGHYVAIDDIQVVDSLITSAPEHMIEPSSFHLYPNPSQGQFTLDVDQSFLGEVYQIHEISGKIVKDGKINANKNHIQLNENAKGIYFLSIPNRNVWEKVVVY